MKKMVEKISVEWVKEWSNRKKKMGKYGGEKVVKKVCKSG